MQTAPKTFLERIKFIGPSVIVTGSVVGSGSIVMTPLLGAAAGFLLLWWLLLSMWSKPIIHDVSIITLNDGKANVFSTAMSNTINSLLDEVPEDKGSLLITGKEGLFSAWWCT